MGKHINTGRLAQNIVTLAALEVWAGDVAEEMPTAESRKKLKCMNSYAKSVLKDMFMSLPLEMRPVAERKAKRYRIDVVPKTQIYKPEKGEVVLTLEEVAELLRADPMECVACERTGEEMLSCPFRELAERHGLALTCEQNLMDAEDDE